MGAGLQLLILLLAFTGCFLLPGPVRAAGCLDCHPAHYVETGDCMQCHRGYPGTRRLEIAHHRLIAGKYAAFGLAGSPVVERGEQLLKDSACRRCHVSAGQGNRLAANLDRSLLHRSPEELLQAIREPALFMPQFHFSDQQLVAQVNAILAAAGKQAPSHSEAPEVVHFVELTPLAEDPFTKNCGGCHRLLSQRLGGLGQGQIGPNLSGLFSAHYPQNFPQGQGWSADNLGKWLKNPRRLRPLAQMPPLQLTPPDLKRVQELVQDSCELGQP